jgi:beta-glucosidase
MILFLGDSIVEWWDPIVFHHYFSLFEPINLGTAGHTTKDTIELIERFSVDNTKPDTIFLMIGTNNSDKKFTTDETFQDIKVILRMLLELYPECRILLIGPLPRGESPSDAKRVFNNEVNKLLFKQRFDNRISYINLSNEFLGENGKISKKIMYDKLHLTGEGYNILSNALFGHFLNLLSKPPTSS